MANDDDILSVLADEYSRKILSILTKNELNAQEISDALGIPTSTTYRKIKNLENLDLVKKTKVIRTLEGLDERYYKSLVSGIDVQFKDGQVSCKIEKFTMDKKIQRLWEKFSEK
ncbi:MAG: winged helix-turn-helix transcriptional regulator [Thaumarchaeota archaeon]|nr:winged helix-turn-helix transcriptional regulator [Nitrososphaerota archaeon]MDE1866206.1 winged helix-turn-helix transcriptional regulator [Nitrososphaerota archaeon]